MWNGPAEGLAEFEHDDVADGVHGEDKQISRKCDR